MKKKQIVSIVFSLIIGLVLSVGLSYVNAAFNLPTSTPPGGNLPVPVNVNPAAQIKNGSLFVGGTFTAYGSARLYQDSFFKGTVFGGASGTLAIGGTDSIGYHKVVTKVNGYAKAQQTLGANELANPNMNHLCADDQGHIVPCTATTGGTGGGITLADYNLSINKQVPTDDASVQLTDNTTGETKTFNCPPNGGTGELGICIFREVIKRGDNYGISVTFTSAGRPRGAPAAIGTDSNFYGEENVTGNAGVIDGSLNDPVSSCAECNSLQAPDFAAIGIVVAIGI